MEKCAEQGPGAAKLSAPAGNEERISGRKKGPHSKPDELREASREDPTN